MRGRDVIGGLIALVGMAALAAASVASRIDGTLSLHGWIAFGLGVGCTLLLALGLVSLLFLSRRRGYDDDAGHL